MNKSNAFILPDLIWASIGRSIYSKERKSIELDLSDQKDREIISVNYQLF